MKRHEEPEKENSERWLLTYSDLITLLLVFFIIMYAMSNLDKAKFSNVMNSLHDTFTISSGTGSSNGVINLPGSNIGESSEPTVSQKTTSPSVSPNIGDNSSQAESKDMNKVLYEVKYLVEQNNLQNDVDVSLHERGLIISIKCQLLFDSGSAQLNNDSLNLLNKISKVLVPLSGKQIRVEGHTDNIPIHTKQYPTNWDLSAARAINALQVLVKDAGLDSKMVSAVGYGEYRPLFINNTDENRSKNRRVDIVIVKDEYKTVDDFTN